MRYKLTIAYDGTLFHGWQRQTRPDGTVLRTVQGVVTDAAAQTLGTRVMVQGASRTDSGVHAEGQVAHFDAETRIPVERLADAINARLPDDVEIRDACVADPAFDAVSGAVDKQYRYRLWTTSRRPLGLRNYVYHCWTPLDVAAMNEAAALIVGEHDFAAFAAAGHGRETTVRTVFACDVQAVARQKTASPQPHSSEPPEEVHIVVRGSGFLYNMVRIIAGTLVDVGRGRHAAEHVKTIFETNERRLAGPTLPPQGLCLEWIKYA